MYSGNLSARAGYNNEVSAAVGVGTIVEVVLDVLGLVLVLVLGLVVLVLVLVLGLVLGLGLVVLVLVLDSPEAKTTDEDQTVSINAIAIGTVPIKAGATVDRKTVLIVIFLISFFANLARTQVDCRRFRICCPSY